MAVEKIQYPIEVIDKFSKPLADFQRRLDGLRPRRNLTDASDKFKLLSERVQSARVAISNGLTAALSAAGIAAFSVAGAIGAAIAAVRSFSTEIAGIRAFSRETGFTINAIRTLEQAAVRFQVEPGSVRAGLKAFSENLYDFRRNYGQVYPEILRLAPDLAGQMRKASPDKALDLALDYLARVPDRQTAGRLSQLLFGTDSIARFGQYGVAELRRILRDTYQRIGSITAEDERNAQAFEDAINRIQQSMDGLAKTVATTAAPVVVPLIEKLDKFVQQNGQAIGTGLADALKAIGAGAKSFNDAVEGSIGWGNLIKGVVAIKLLQTASSLGAIALWLRNITLAAKALPLLALGKVAALVGAGYATVQGFRLGARADTGPLSLQRMQLERQRFVLENLITNASDPKRRAELEAKRDAVVKQIDSLSRQIEQLTAAGAEQGVKDFVAKHPALPDSAGIGATPWGGGGGSTGAATSGMSGRLSDTATGGGARQAAGGTPGGAGGGRTPGGANYMGGPLPGRSAMTSFKLPQGQRVTVNREAADAFKGFLTDIENAGAPLGSIGGYNERRIAGSGRWSQHSYGNAVDIGSQTGRDIVSPKFRAWIARNRETWDAALRRWNMIDGGKWRRPDLGHVEWAGPRGQAYRSARESGMVADTAVVQPGNRPASVDITLGGVSPIAKTNNAVPLFRQVEMNRGRSMLPAYQDQ